MADAAHVHAKLGQRRDRPIVRDFPPRQKGQFQRNTEPVGRDAERKETAVSTGTLASRSAV
jgi:hypothetical protein